MPQHHIVAEPGLIQFPHENTIAWPSLAPDTTAEQRSARLSNDCMPAASSTSRSSTPRQRTCSPGAPPAPYLAALYDGKNTCWPSTLKPAISFCPSSEVIHSTSCIAPL